MNPLHRNSALQLLQGGAQYFPAPVKALDGATAWIQVEDKGFAGQLRDAICAAIASHGRRLDPAAYSRRPRGQRILDYLAYALMRLAILVAGQRY